MAAGIGFGQSTVALIVTRGCKEMRILAKEMGGRPETLAGLSGKKRKETIHSFIHSFIYFYTAIMSYLHHFTAALFCTDIFALYIVCDVGVGDLMLTCFSTLSRNNR